MLRAWGAALLLLLSVQASAQLRIASINMCADELLLLLAPPEAIVSLSYLSQDPQYSRWVQSAKAYPVNYAGAEEILALQPDLVLAGQYSDPMVIRLLRQQGITVYQMTRPTQLSAMFDEAQHIGRLLGREAQAERLVLGWRQAIDRLTVTQQVADRPSMALIGPNGFTEGRGSLRDQMLQLAGIVNLATALGIDGNGELSLEQLVANGPDMIAIEDGTDNQHSLAQRLLKHPAIEQLAATRVRLPANLWTCPGPSYVDALATLIEARKTWQQ
jgi:iron complex transport system substrate-binding protein